MLYREAGQFKTSYSADQAMLTIPLDRLFVFALAAFAIVGVPLLASEYLMVSICSRC